jgi:hypothetical protein
LILVSQQKLGQALDGERRLVLEAQKLVNDFLRATVK